MKNLEKIINETSKSKLLSVFTYIPLTAIFSKELISTLSLWINSTENDLDNIKNTIIKLSKEIDFKDINNIKKYIPLLLIFLTHQNYNKSELNKFLENRWINIYELSGNDFIAYNYLWFLLVDCWFLDPDLIFNNNIDDLIDIYIEIEKNTKKLPNEWMYHWMLFELYSLIEYLILVYENQWKFHKIMKKEANLEKTKIRFKSLIKN